MEREKIYNQIVNEISGAKKILLVCHEKPDGDTIGATCALMNFFAEKNISYKGFCIDSVSMIYNYIPKTERIENEISTEEMELFDLIFTIDCGEIKRTGIADLLNQRNCKLINIDHHDTNNCYGDINLVSKQASSTSEIIYEFFQQKFYINKNIATALLTGMLDDTEIFSNPATNYKVIKASSELLLKGANTQKIIRNIFHSRTIESLKFWGEILSRLHHNQEHNIISTYITLNDIKTFNLNDEDAATGISNYIKGLAEADVVLVLREQEGGFVKGSLRTIKDGIDVAKIASLFGGGGHKKAAGFKVKGKIKVEDEGWRIV